MAVTVTSGSVSMIQPIITDIEMLRQISSPVTTLDDPEELNTLFKDLEDTISARHGKLVIAGLAAVQIGVLKRVIMINYGQYRKLIMINPKLTEATGRMKHDEMCVSVPGKVVRRTRKQYIRVDYLDRNWNPKNQVFTGLEAVIVQHEMDHLDGETLYDH